MLDIWRKESSPRVVHEDLKKVTKRLALTPLREKEREKETNI